MKTMTIQREQNLSAINTAAAQQQSAIDHLTRLTSAANPSLCQSIVTDLNARLEAAIERFTHTKLVVVLTLLMSICMNEDVSARFTLKLLNAFAAGLCAFLFGGISLMVQLLLLAWLAVSVWHLARK